MCRYERIYKTVHLCTFVCVCVHTSVCVRTCVRMCTRVGSHTHTHTQYPPISGVVKLNCRTLTSITMVTTICWHIKYQRDMRQRHYCLLSIIIMLQFVIGWRMKSWICYAISCKIDWLIEWDFVWLIDWILHTMWHFMKQIKLYPWYFTTPCQQTRHLVYIKLITYVSQADV